MINLSQQLCNVCGVKPEIIQDYELNDIEIYPDFEDNNNNFIKLFELSLPKICGVKFTISQLLCESVEFSLLIKEHS